MTATSNYLVSGAGSVVSQNPSTGSLLGANGYRIKEGGNWFDNTVVLFGDSHTLRNGPIWTARSGGPGYELTDDLAGGQWAFGGMDGYFNQAQIIANWPFRVLYNAAVGGETIAQINARIDAAMKKYQPKFAVYMGGTNNVQDSGITSIATADAAVATAISDIQTGWNKILSYGAVVLAYTIPPRTGLSGFQRRAWSQVNRWIRQNVGKIQGVYLAGDAAKAAANPTTGDWLASGEYGAIVTTNSGDSIHGSTYGYYLIGCESAARLNALFTSRRQGLSTPDLAYDITNGNNPYGNLLTNGKLLGTGGNPASPQTGLIPDGWLVQATPTAPTGGTIVTSKVARNITSADATGVEEVGEWLQVTMTGSSGEGNMHLRQDISGNAWAVGDVISASLQFETDAAGWNNAAAGASDIILTVEFNGNGSNGRISYSQNASAVQMGRKPSGTIRTPEAKIPAGTTVVYVRIYFRGQGTWRISDVDLSRVPDRTATGI